MADEKVTTVKDAANKADTVIIKNASARLYIIEGVKLLPTEARTFPREALEAPGVKMAFEDDELVEAQEECDPILDEKEAEKEAAARKKAQQQGKRNRN